MSTDLERELRDALRGKAGEVGATPDPWRRVDDAVRSSRRRRRATAVGATAVAAATLMGGVTTWPAVSDRFGQQSAVSAASQDGPSALDTGQVRGSLGTDAAWLAAFRQQAARDGDGRSMSADDIRVLYAADVGRWRIALHEAPAREGSGRTQWWSVGARGAAADAMTTWVGNQARDLAWLWWGPTLDGSPVAGNAPTDQGVLVVVGARSGTVTLAGTPTFSADGSARFPQRAVPPVEPDVHQDVVPLTSTSRLWLALPQQPPGWLELTGPQVPADETLLAGALPAVHAGARPAAEDLLHRDVLPAMQARSGLDVAASERRVLWSGRMGGWTTHVVAITARSGANVVFTSRVKAGEERSGRFSHRNQEAVALPAGRLDRIAYAWAFGSPDDVTTPPTHVGVVAPAAAVVAELTAAGGAGSRVALADGVGTLALGGLDPERARVTLRDARGGVLTTIPVTGDTVHGLEPPLP